MYFYLTIRENVNLIQERERESCKQMQMGPWGMLLLHLPQIAVAERSYADLGFLNTKNKGFLRKDVRRGEFFNPLIDYTFAL
jgi:hypothetical protein